MNDSDEKILIRFGRNIANVRKEKKITQEQLSFLSDLDRSYISGVESGKRNISIINIFKIAAALDISPGQLFDFK